MNQLVSAMAMLVLTELGGDNAAKMRAVLEERRKQPIPRRACMDCPNVYDGPLECPACGAPGEPLACEMPAQPVKYHNSITSRADFIPS